MKKIFTLFAVMLGLAFTASAQSDLAILTSLKSVDTVRFKTDGTLGKIIVYAFVNHGPNALTSSDTIVWRGPVFGTVSLRLPAAGVPATDTVYYVDTLVLTAMPSGSGFTNPLNWCDSIWAKHSGGAIIADPVPSNNKKCQSVRFIQVSSGVGVANVGTKTEELSVYPNPANSLLNFGYTFGANTTASVVLRDLLGKSVIEKDLGKGLSGKQTYSLDISSLQNGIYFLELSHNGAKAVSRVVIQK